VRQHAYRSSLCRRAAGRVIALSGFRRFRRRPRYGSGSDLVRFYVGVEGGGARAKTSSDETIDFNLKPKGAFGGLFAGYNVELEDGTVFGIEASANLADFNDDKVFVYPDTITTTDVLKSRTTATAGLRLKAGHAYGSFLPYVTGGLALARNRVVYGQTWTISPPPMSLDVDRLDQTRWRRGWSAGAGLQYAVSDGWGVKAEYLYTRFIDERYYGSSIFGDWSMPVPLRYQTLSLGVQYQF
jgi:outer membrane immunogenic protein